ncbi:MAG: hypothetical protein NC131_08870 [Roseburia sp.]|nr:hypothetical protein [Roseburia sp.]
MSKNEKTKQNHQSYIYIRSTGEQIPVTKQEFTDYYRPINAYRKKQQAHGRCVCPKSRRLMCDMDCYTCPYRRAGDTISLDYPIEDGAGSEKNLLDDLCDDSSDIQSILEERELLVALYRRLEELDPEGKRICRLIMAGKSERESAKIMGIARSTYKRHKEKLMADLFESLKDYI